MANNYKFRILIASDIHLGFMERHHERGEDTFRAFEEVLALAYEEDVDFILLGGDLFHLNKPSFRTLKRCNELLRKYCFGSRPIQYRIVSDQSDNFSHYKDFKYANYLDPNLNVSMPVFTIHGNHDDPTGANPISSLETLSSCGLINYFGKYTNVEEILLTPILMEKGNCKIALYGLGSINEERLYRIVTNGKLNYCMPEGGDNDDDQWFKVVVVHQNRVKRANTKHLPERFLSQLPDLVVWGHEHESNTELDYNESENFFVYQPGSTVATSLSESEAGPKHCGILEVFFNESSGRPEFKITYQQIKSVRQFIWHTINIQDLIKRRQIEAKEQAIEEYCKEKVNSMIQQARLEHTGDKRQPKLPLIRLRLEYTDEYQKFHIAKFGSHFDGKVANAAEIISYVKRRDDSNVVEDGNFDLNEMKNLLDQEVIGERVNIEDIIREYFSNAEQEKSQLALLSENALTLAVKEFVEKDSSEAINEVYETQKEKMKDYLNSMSDLNVDEIRDKIRMFRIESMKEEDSDIARILQNMRKQRVTVKNEPNDDNEDNKSDLFVENDVETDEEMRAGTSTQATGRGRGRGRGRAKKTQDSGRGKRLTQTTLDIYSVASNSAQNRVTTSTRSKRARTEPLYTVSSDSD